MIELMNEDTEQFGKFMFDEVRVLAVEIDDECPETDENGDDWFVVNLCVKAKNLTKGE